MGDDDFTDVIFIFFWAVLCLYIGGVLNGVF